jgi:L-ascorbate metabolism protein UlaG (beta-lactamase superfamily)
MKITFIGMSSYLIEDKCGGRLLIDLFKDAPEYSFGLTLPKKLYADIFLASHADSDHSNLDEKFTEHKRNNHEKHEADINIFPNFNLRGTLVKEWNGDLCMAYHFTVDGLRCLHLSDNSHPLTEKQIAEFGQIDILFISMPKSKSNVVNTELEIIKKLDPKIIIPTHTIPLPLKIIRKGHKAVYEKLSKIILPATLNSQANTNTVEVFSYMLLAAENLTNYFAMIEITGTDVEIKKTPKKPTVYYFDKCLAKHK